MGASYSTVPNPWLQILYRTPSIELTYILPYPFCFTFTEYKYWPFWTTVPKETFNLCLISEWAWQFNHFRTCRTGSIIYSRFFFSLLLPRGKQFVLKAFSAMTFQPTVEYEYRNNSGKLKKAPILAKCKEVSCKKLHVDKWNELKF